MTAQKRNSYLRCFLLPLCNSLLFFFTLNSWGQVPQDTLLANQLGLQGDSLYEAKQYTKALDFFKEAKSAYAAAESWVRVANTSNKMAKVHVRLDQYEQLRTQLLESQEIISEKTEGTILEEGEVYELMSTYYELGKLDLKTTLGYLQKTEAIFEALPGTKDKLVNILNRIAVLHIKLGDYKNAQKVFDKALKVGMAIYGETHAEIAKIYNNKGILHNRLGETEAAVENFEKAVSMRLKLFGENHMSLYSSYVNLSDCYRNFFNLRKAKYYSDKLLDLIQENKINNPKPLSFIYASRSLLFSKMRQDEKSIEFAKIALSSLDKIYGEPHIQGGPIYRTMAQSLYNIGDYEEAVSFEKQALDLYLKTYGEKHNKTGEAYVNLGIYYRENGDVDQAIAHHKMSVDIYTSIHGHNHEQMPQLYKALAKDYAKLKKDSLQFYYLKKAQEVRNRIHVMGHVRRVGGLIDLSNAYIDKDQLSYAREYLDLVLKEQGQLFNIGSETMTYEKAITWLDVYTLKAKWYRNNYKESKKKSDLENSLASYAKMDSLVDKLTVNFENENDRISFYERSQELYQDAIEAQFTYSAIEPQAKEKTFYFMEKSKANNLRKLVNQGDIERFSDIPQQTVEKEQELKTKRAYYQSKLAQLEEGENSTDGIKTAISEKLFAVNVQYDSLMKVMQISYPDFTALKHNNSVLNIEETQKALQKDAVLLQYLYTDSNGYLLLLSDNAFDVSRFDAENLEEDIEALITAITNKDLKAYKQKAVALYSTLLEPVAEKLDDKELIIVPYGKLWKLNFDLLLTKNDATNNPKELPYLLRQNPISYVNSATLRFGRAKKERNVLQECLAFSFTSQDSTLSGKEVNLSRLRDNGADLPGTREEIKEIAKLLDGVYYFGDAAKESNFKANASSYAILHLALHGEVNDEKPENSRLFFTQAKDSIEDNNLFTHELYALNLPAELAVLSACSTGIGKVTSGEGIISLGNAFQYAGTQSLLLSHWEVSDTTTPELMKYFYSNLKKGMTKSKALQQAKLRYLETAKPNRTAPFYWGSFYMLGDNSPMDFSEPNYLLWAFIVVALFAIGWFFLRRKKMYS